MNLVTRGRLCVRWTLDLLEALRERRPVSLTPLRIQLPLDF